MIDISKFKKAHEDANSAVLIHPDGHRIQVAKSALNKANLDKLGKLQGYADGGTVTDIPGADVMAQAGAPGMMQQPMAPVLPEAPAAAPVAQPMPQNYPISAQRQPSAMSGLADVNSGMLGGLQQGFATQERGLQQEAAAAQQLGTQEAQAAEMHQQQMQQIAANHQKNYDAINSEIKNTVTDIEKGKIDPSHWWNQKSEGGKVATVIGLLLGGIGQGLMKSQTNPASDFIDQQIDRDINAQKMELGKKESILSAYQRQLGNLNDATAMTKAFYMDKYAADIQKAAALSKSPLAQARAQQEIGRLQNEKAQILGPLAMRQTIMQGGKAGDIPPDTAVRFLVPKEQQNEAFKELTNAQLLKKKTENALKAFDTVAEAKTTGFTLGHPLRTLSGAASNQMNLAIVELARDASGAFNKDEVEHMRKQLEPSRFDTAEDIAAKRKSIAEFSTQKANFPLLKSFGIQPPMYQGENVQKTQAPASYKR